MTKYLALGQSHNSNQGPLFFLILNLVKESVYDKRKTFLINFTAYFELNKDFLYALTADKTSSAQLTIPFAQDSTLKVQM